ncbi:DUF4270 domain-containing protein [Flavobacterium humi]|uniref:DUF4270 domain-containing protein n=1 Tax=Flavobacterium humi TaxID=2562683 RepID=UPI00146DADD4|nr:DUF4270 domain-containing protein [Flavobacterium humi]
MAVVLFASCDKDFNSVGSDIVGNENFDLEHQTFATKVYNQKIQAIQTNNTAIGQLGILDNPVFGKTKADFVAQLILLDEAPEFKSNIVVDSVILTVPYFSTKTEIKSNGLGIYELDSIHGSGSINLQVLRNGFTLNEFDPGNNFETAQKYYSDQQADFDNNIVGSALNNSSLAAENTAFLPSEKEYVKYKVDASFNMMPKIAANVEARNSPRMRLHLDTNYFKTNIIDAPADKLINNNAFKSYFKGLYFKVTDAPAGSLMSLDFSKGDVTIYYKQDITVTTGPPSSSREMKNLVLSMATGIKINLLKDTDSPDYTAAFTAPNQQNFDAKKLFVKGGQGSNAFIELFTPAQLTELKAQNVLVNEASLTFTVDSSLPNNYSHPLRLYLYDAETGQFLYDYAADPSTVTSNPKLNKYVYGGILEKTAAGKRTYKIRITGFVDRILKGKTDNVRLGLVVTESIGAINSMSLKTPSAAPSSTDNTKTQKAIPAGSVMSHFGTVLYGNGNSAADDVKFEIYYTKPN